MIEAVATFSLALLSVVLIWMIYLRRAHPEPHLDWGRQDLDSIKFPENFHWGVATAAHQVEGGLRNNWTAFEESKDMELSGDACDHWRLWEQDFQMLSDLGLNTYRFSIEWSRLEPEEGAWEEGPLKEYSKMVDDLLSRGIRPMVTLHHFSHPHWWEDKGGFSNAENIPDFVRYCDRVHAALSDRVKVWCTINEPVVFSSMGYALGQFPPGKRSITQTVLVMKNMMVAHSKVYNLLKSKDKDSSIGFAKNVTLFDPTNRWSPLDWAASRLLDWIWNGAWQRAIQKGRMFGSNIEGAKSSLDFIGLNYYTHFVTGLFVPTATSELDFQKRDNEVETDFGYPMYAEGFRRAIEYASAFGVPIEVTENGVADASDSLRPEHLKRHLWILSEAIKDGYDVRSFHYWSLMDNFEWAEGYSMRFGLYEVNYENQSRSLRQSGEIYRDLIKAQLKR